MKRSLLSFLVVFGLSSVSANADDRFIVRDSNGLSGIQTVCALLGCTVAEGLDQSLGQLFLVTTPDSVDPTVFLKLLQNAPAVVDAEIDQVAHTSHGRFAIPSGLSDIKPVKYYGETVPQGYVDQPATAIIRLSYAQHSFHVKGAGIVAVIDTGIDPDHPALKHSLVPGYDFTRDKDGEGDETDDVTLYTRPRAGTPKWVNSQGAARVDQSTAAVVDGNKKYGDFGHGTMVSGIIHLVAPGAYLMPLKAFRANGTGYNADIIRAVYFAVFHNANVINMSFNLAGDSTEMKKAIDYADNKGIISAAAAGNSGKETIVYPAGYSDVMGIASTNDKDQRSSFSNYGPKLVWVAAPGEGIITTYPFGLYAAGWGTSFSTPFVSGVAALMLDLRGSCDESESADAMAHAKPLGRALGHGRLDAYQALNAWHDR
ncbi:MAG: S8 family serine peptidase [Acidobacteriaceae bacterium]|nr:S8 family serine peptidase [Acidobacteriaceae bacterium]MBV9779404.1 S8 family serine peptidase [Acidobacteriaceae bacterium]